jgi:hypothetical protein
MVSLCVSFFGIMKTFIDADPSPPRVQPVSPPLGKATNSTDVTSATIYSVTFPLRSTGFKVQFVAERVKRMLKKVSRLMGLSLHVRGGLED